LPAPGIPVISQVWIDPVVAVGVVIGLFWVVTGGDGARIQV
jgi:hypothetical protein